MTETVTAETTTVDAVETPKQGALKRFAKAFYAKVSKAAQAVKASIVRNVDDNETPVREDEGVIRKALRYVTAVPKWIGHGVVFIAQSLLFAAFLIVLGVVIIVGAVLGAVLSLVWFAAMTVFKVIQGLALIVRTPYLIVRGDDCLKTDYAGYAYLWTPKHFACTRISQVFYAQATEAKEREEAKERHPSMADVKTPAEHTEKAATLSVVGQQPKGRPTNRQRKYRPARIPAAAEA